MARHYVDRLTSEIAKKGTAAVVGIDPVIERLPDELKPTSNTAGAAAGALEKFSREIIDLVAPLVPAVKINSGFFEACYEAGVAAYYRCVAHAHHAGLLVIGDIKRGDIGSTTELYARGHIANPTFDDLDPNRIPDAVTLAGYLGANAVMPFARHCREHGRGLYVLVRPSDPGADFVHQYGEPRQFYQHMAELVHRWGRDEEFLNDDGWSCVGAVVAPKDAESTTELRKHLALTPFLVPGYGAQGADAEACRACFSDGGDGAVVNAGRSVIYAYSREEIRAKLGDDWKACVRHAAELFAADIKRVTTG